MQIVNLKIKMSRFGICSTDSPKSKAIYVPIAFISYKGNKPTKKEVYLQAPSLSNKNGSSVKCVDSYHAVHIVLI